MITGKGTSIADILSLAESRIAAIEEVDHDGDQHRYKEPQEVKEEAISVIRELAEGIHNA